jgi:anti-sigma regulatory factor (Ser/Thr protein kinase)
VLAAEYDWSESELGPQEQWAPAVKAVVSILLEATVPVAYCHGADYAIVYNDRFADVLGANHPQAWGQRAAVVLPDIWSRHGLAEVFDEVFAGGPSFHDDGERLGLDGEHVTGPGTAYFVRSCSAVRDSDGSVLGVVVVAAAIASAPVGVREGANGDLRLAKWRGIEMWDETVARLPLIWSGFHARASSSEAIAADGCPRFVAEGGGLILGINGPEVTGGSQGMEPHLQDPRMVTPAAPDQPVGSRTAAGGDFYDGFALPDGRIALAIGEVVGCGVGAAAVMQQVRASLRGAALTNCDPNAIFTALDRLVSCLALSAPTAEADGQDCPYAGDAGCGELFVTALLAVFDPATGELLLASAGQLPPAVVHGPAAATAQANPGRLAEFAKLEPGPRLGIAGNRPVLRLVLEERDALIAFTDGLLERHEKTLTQEQTMLLWTLSTMAATASRSISQHVVDKLNGGEGLQHEGALLVVVRDSRIHHMASVLVPPQASAVRGARRWVRGQLEAWGIGEEVEAAAVLGVSELVTNVVLHAGTPARVSMELADRLLVTVEDTGTRGVPQPKPRVDRYASRGRGLALVAAASSAMGHSRRPRGSTVWFEIARDPVSH